METNRRGFLVSAVACVLTASCAKDSNESLSGPSPISQPTLPTPTPSASTSSLLSRVQQLGYSASRVAYGNNGAARITINGSVNWNFLVNGDVVGLNGNSPSEDVSAISVPSSSNVTVAVPR